MKLNESKNQVPATFVTTYIADAWEKVGYINADIEQIKKEYADTAQLTEILQDLSDAYLIAAGRLQAYMDKKDYVDLPSDDEIRESLILKESVGDDIDDAIQTAVDQTATQLTAQVAATAMAANEDLDTDIAVELAPTQPKQPIDEFEFSCDFDDADLSDADQENIAAARRSLGPYNF